MTKKLSLLLLSLTLLTNCSTKTNESEEDEAEEVVVELGSTKKVSISKEVINQMLQMLPKPIEIANIITNSKIGFSKEALLPADAHNNYNDNYYQAMGFGAYGVDLGYINLNNKSLYTLEYLESLSKLAKKLSVDQFFDFETLSAMTKNRNDPDSIVRISTQNFNKIDDYLKDQNRGELSVLILMGSWIEGMHVFTKMNSKEAGTTIAQKLAEQKVVFENAYTILEKLKEIKFFVDLKGNFENLKKEYDKVKISYEYQQPETKEVNGELIIVDKTKTIAEYKPEDIKRICEEVEKIRTNYLIAKH
jgi:hypothetical protein